MSVVTAPEVSRALAVDGIGYIALPVSDLKAAKAFYSDLGFRDIGHDLLPNCGTHAAMRAASGQMLALVAAADLPDLRDSGVHQAYRVSTVERQSIITRLEARGETVFRYKEDRPAEENDNFYCFDPSGNRVQLVAAGGLLPGGVIAIDHAAVQVADMLWTEHFYTVTLGLTPDHYVGWRTADYVRARKWADGEEDMAPGTRRLDKRYTVMVNRKTVPRCNMQLYVKAGISVLGFYLSNKHWQETPEEQAIGTPRIALAVPRGELDRVAKLVAVTGRAVEGPVEHATSSPIEASVYFRDTGGNFVELCTLRAR